MTTYAGRFTDPAAIAIHRERSRTWAQRARARGVCVICGQAHARPGRQAGTRATRCESCAVKSRIAATAWRKRKQGTA